MTKFKEIASKNIPLYVTVIVFLGLAGIIAAVAYIFFKENIYVFTGRLPDSKFLTEELEYGSMPVLTNKNFFKEVRDKFIEDRASFIEADLSAMKLTIYEDGNKKTEYPILTKGREGSWWETPAGLYRVESKIKNHYSNFAGVYLPWSMPFQGNFFIHGWPYYKDGSPVASKYSGGCIRLSTEDAEKVFAQVKVGTPVLVFEQDFAADNFEYRYKTKEFESKRYLAADLKNNFVFAERESKAQVPVASITKLVTAMVAVEYMNIEKEITVTEEMLAKTSRSRLKVGQTISLYNLLPLLLMESSNEAAVAISHFLGPKRFVDLMNKKAQAIGMTNSRFEDPSGIGEGNISTAEDLFALAKYLYNNRSFILKMSKGEVDQRVYGPLDYPDIEPFNGFIEDPQFIGGKVGQTLAAGETIIALFELKIGENTRPVAVILLDSPERFKETTEIIDWIKTSYY